MRERERAAFLSLGASLLDFSHLGGWPKPWFSWPKALWPLLLCTCMLACIFAYFLHRVGVHICMPPILKHSHALRGYSHGNWFHPFFAFRVRAMSHARLLCHRCMSCIPSMHALYLLIGLDAMLACSSPS